MTSQTRIRVLHFLNSPDTPGGVEEHVRSLVEALPAERFEVSLVCPSVSYPVFRYLEAAHCRVFCLDLFKFLHFQSMRRLIAILRQQRIQIAHSHQFLATLFLAPIAKLAGVPFVVETPHVREAWRRSWWKRSNLIDRVVYLLVDRFIAVSNANRQYMTDSKHCPSSKIQLIYNGRDLSYFHSSATVDEELRKEYGIDSSDVLLVHVGRLELQKGHHFLFEALQKVCARGQRVKLVLVGEGTLLESLKRECAQLGITGIVQFVGFQKDVRRFLQGADIVVLPSLWEGLPLVLVEAAAMGKPIIATSVDGNPEAVLDGKTGLLVMPGNSEQIAATILHLASDERLRRKMGVAARRLAEERFSLQAQVRSTIELYESLIQTLPTHGNHSVHRNPIDATTGFRPEMENRVDFDPAAHGKQA